MNIDMLDRLAGALPEYTPDDQARLDAISAAVPGYSDYKQYSFFKHLFRTTDVSKILILGVYFGRDVCLMADAAQRRGRAVSITGVDKFSDDFCDDWPEEMRDRSWEQVGYGPAPTLQAAQANIGTMGFADVVTLHKQRDDQFLAGCTDKFDFIYIDTAHDYATVRRQIYQCLPLLNEGGLMAGDDYSDRGTWGVKRALQEIAPGHLLHQDWIWVTDGRLIVPEANLPKEPAASLAVAGPSLV